MDVAERYIVSEAEASRPKRRLQMALLTAIVTAASYAGNSLSPLQESVRVGLALSDNQMALLQGPALALPMVLAAIPLGLLIDRYSRVRLLLILTLLDAIGSLFTAFADSFAYLFAARCVIGLAAFAVNPVACSLIADLYPPSQRGRANMVVVFGQSGGMAVVFAVGGVLLSAFSNQPPAWHWAMLGLTVPLVLVLGLTVPMKEPVRTGRAVENPSTLEVWREVLKYQSLILPIMAGVVVGQIALGADYIWAAPMLSRSFTLSPERLGAIMALGFLISGVLGSIAGGVLADLCHRVGGPRKTLTVLIILSSMSVPIGLFALLRDPIFSISLLVASITVATAISVMGTTLFVVVIPNELRGLCTSVMMAICVIIGSGLAPLLVSGLATEMGGDAYIGRALSFVCVATSLLGAGFFAWGRRSFARSKANNSLRDGSQVMTESGN